jgi:hypothetical protein
VRVYVAASALRQDDARWMRNVLQSAGHVVTSRWIDVKNVGYVKFCERDADGNWIGTTSEVEQFLAEGIRLTRSAQEDMQDVLSADAVVCITGDAYTKGGRHSEVGLAIGASKKVVIYGPREQVFHFHPLCVEARTSAEVLRALE